MRIDIFKALLENSTLLVVSYLLLTKMIRWESSKKPLINSILYGIVFGLCGVLSIVFSFEILPGILIDMRAPVIVIAALTGGVIAGFITITPLLVYRLLIGGDGMMPGMGIIFSSLLFGLLLRKAEKSHFKIQNLLFQLLAGFGSALIYLIWINFLPASLAKEVFDSVSLPLCFASVISILTIFYIRARDHAHESRLEKLNEINSLYEEISIDENIGILILHKTKIMYINQSLLSKYGFTRFDENNTDLFDIVDESTQKRLEKFLNLQFTTSPSSSFPMEISLNNRNSLHFLIHARKLLYKGKNCLLVVSVDISNLIKTEKDLQNKLDQLQLTLEASGAISWSASIADDTLASSKDFFDFLAYSPPTNPPKFSHWLLELSLSDQMQKNMDSLCAGEIKSVFGEISYKGDDFVTRWFNIGAIVKGNPPEISGIIFDTTAIKEKELSSMQDEIENIQSQKMEALGRLAGGVAHDFNNLLHVILGYCDILNRVSDNDPVIVDVSKPIVEAAGKGRDLVKQLLLFSREKKPQLQSVNLNELVTGFCKMLSRIMEDNIIVNNTIHTDASYTFGDSGQIEQVLMNLCVNARDAMADGGKIEISLSEQILQKPLKVTSGFVKSGNFVVITVTDTGTGIPESKINNIFEPFFTTKNIDKGTGLGLATVLGIVREHSGYINVRNRKGKGLEIKVYFQKLKIASIPVLDELKKKNTQIHTEVRPICVLLAEDDPQVMNLAIEGLGASGIRVLPASNGLEAVEIFKTRKDDIEMLVFDVMMPELSGPDAYRKILSLGANLPIVFTTGYAGDRLTDMKESHKILNKPYLMNDLVSLIRKMTNTKSGEK